eukprot:3112733-Lingulodinium_polyedra.AAC.1
MDSWRCLARLDKDCVHFPGVLFAQENLDCAHDEALRAVEPQTKGPELLPDVHHSSQPGRGLLFWHCCCILIL